MQHHLGSASCKPDALWRLSKCFLAVHGLGGLQRYAIWHSCGFADDE